MKGMSAVERAVEAVFVGYFDKTSREKMPPLIEKYFSFAELLLYGQSEEMRTQLINVYAKQVIAELKLDPKLQEFGNNEVFWKVIATILSNSLLENYNVNDIEQILQGRIYFQCLESGVANMQRRGGQVFVQLRQRDRNQEIKTLPVICDELRLGVNAWLNRHFLLDVYDWRSWNQLYGWCGQKQRARRLGLKNIGKSYVALFYIQLAILVWFEYEAIQFACRKSQTLQDRHVKNAPGALAIFINQHLEVKWNNMVLWFLLYAISNYFTFNSMGRGEYDIIKPEWATDVNPDEFRNTLSKMCCLVKGATKQHLYERRQVAATPQSDEDSISLVGRSGITDAEYSILSRNIYVREGVRENQKSRASVTVLTASSVSLHRHVAIASEFVAESMRFYFNYQDTAHSKQVTKVEHGQLDFSDFSIYRLPEFAEGNRHSVPVQRFFCLDPAIIAEVAGNPQLSEALKNNCYFKETQSDRRGSGFYQTNEKMLATGEGVFIKFKYPSDIRLVSTQAYSIEQNGQRIVLYLMNRIVTHNQMGPRQSAPKYDELHLSEVQTNQSVNFNQKT